MKSFAFSKGRLMGFICSILLPIIAMGLGILMLIKDVMLNIGFAIIYFFIPLITAGFLGWCIFFNRKTWKKFVLSGIILALFLVVFFFSSFFTGWTQVKCYGGNEAVQQYTSVKSESKMLPDLSELGRTTDIEHYNVFACFYIFSSETDYLICRYTRGI